MSNIKLVEKNIGKCLNEYKRPDAQEIFDNLKAIGGKVLCISQFSGIVKGGYLEGTVSKSDIDGFLDQVITLNEYSQLYRTVESGTRLYAVLGETKTSFKVEYLTGIIDSSD